MNTASSPKLHLSKSPPWRGPDSYRGGVGYKVIVLAVAHCQFLSINLKAHKNNGAVIYDVKGILAKELTDGRV